MTGVQTCALPIYETLEKIRDALIGFEEAYNNFNKDNRGEFAKQLAFITGIWIEPAKMAEDITNVVKLIQADQPFGRSEERRVGKECRSRWSPYH